MKRAFEIGELQLRDDGLTVEGRIVPYDEPSEVVELDKATNELVKYTEVFQKRSCLGMVQAVAKRGNAAFIKFLLEHEEHAFDAKIGYATNLRDEPDGAWATFRLYESRDIDKVRSMLQTSHKGLSVSFGDVRPPRIADGVVSRVQVHIDHVAATPVPVYAGALITSVRGDVMPEYGTPKLDELEAWLASMKA